jgi:retron-type reverse transcriptase
MVYNQKLETINLPNTIIIGNQFMYFNKVLKKASMPNLRSIGSTPLMHNESISEFFVPSLTSNLENHRLRKLAKKSKPKLLTRILNNGK